MVIDNNNDTTTHKGKPAPRPGQMARLLLIAVLILAGLIWLGQWLWYRHTHVVEDNASVTTDLVTVSSRLSGRVDAFPLENGDPLVKGQIVAELYSQPEQLELDQRQARVASMEARLTFEQQQIEQARRQLQGGISNAEQQLQAARTDLKVAEVELEDAEQSWQRADTLFQSGSLSRQQRDRNYYDLMSARARLETARQQVTLRQSQRDTARLGLFSGSTMSLPTPELLEAQTAITRQQLVEAEANVRQQQALLADMTVTSPADGVVARTFIETGEYLSAGQPILMMYQPDNVWIEAKIKETDVRNLSPGQEVKIRVDAWPDTDFSGRIQVIGRSATSEFALIPSSNPSGNFTKVTQRIPVRISVDKGDRSLLSPGMMVVIAVNTRAAD
ncbi:HlyD family secretion protein [Marinobacter zhanjiangensis]|uniref:Secretion protein n=1 Tax=Marinobacter zhanjiangensis TaxID=578215 RepID=A0ABQ3BBH3_9GAMM|nr:HlyD family secretion protein [Marinobacter zhanjiangensis]GGY84532.1 secretion protein [Marinobacter zhanjiangensis]